MLLLALFGQVAAQSPLDALLPVRGFCIAAPEPAGIDAFIRFIDEELAPRRVNTLVLRVDYDYAYESHPELRSENPLSRSDVKKLVTACRRHGIRIVPQVNLLGHQSWAESVGKLLEVYPQFDETPHVEMPEKYQWPNDDGLYCKSYCPLHPEVHAVVFAIVDELLDAFEADAFHAGLDEVFYLADDRCPRCGGRDPAELFAGEVTLIRNHLAQKGRELWIWGDRLIDGKITGIGMWEASMNNTARAIDWIPRDVVICDWHYERAVPTAAYFATKGFRVITCPWRTPAVALEQLESTRFFREHSTPEMSDRYLGMMQTIWTSSSNFLDRFYGRRPFDGPEGKDQAECFRQLFAAIGALR